MLALVYCATAFRCDDYSASAGCVIFHFLESCSLAAGFFLPPPAAPLSSAKGRNWAHPRVVIKFLIGHLEY